MHICSWKRNKSNLSEESFLSVVKLLAQDNVELRLSAIRKKDISQDVNKLVGNLVADKRLAANCVRSRDCFFVSYYNKSAANLPLIYCN